MVVPQDPPLLRQHLLPDRGRLRCLSLGLVRPSEVVHGRQRVRMVVPQDPPPLRQHLLLDPGRLRRLPLGLVRPSEVVHGRQRIRMVVPQDPPAASPAPPPRIVAASAVLPWAWYIEARLSWSSACQDGRPPGSACASPAPPPRSRPPPPSSPGPGTSKRGCAWSSAYEDGRPPGSACASPAPPPESWPPPPSSPGVVRQSEVVHGRQRVGMVVPLDPPALRQHLLPDRGRLRRPPLGMYVEARLSMVVSVEGWSALKISVFISTARRRKSFTIIDFAIVSQKPTNSIHDHGRHSLSDMIFDVEQRTHNLTNPHATK